MILWLYFLKEFLTFERYTIILIIKWYTWGWLPNLRWVGCQKNKIGNKLTTSEAEYFTAEYLLVPSKILVHDGIPQWFTSKESTYNAGDLGSIPGLGRSPGEGNPLQYSCLENPMDRGAWWATVHGVTKDLDMT